MLRLHTAAAAAVRSTLVMRARSAVAQGASISRGAPAPRLCAPFSAAAAPSAGKPASTPAAPAAAAASTSSSPSAASPRSTSHIRLRPHLDYRFVRDHADAVQSNIVVRGSASFASAHRVKELYERSLAEEFRMAQLRKKKNDFTRSIKVCKDKTEREKLVAESRALNAELTTAEAELDALNEQLETEGLRIPNSTSSETPIGAEGTGRVIKLVGTARPAEGAADHLSLCARWSLLDLDAGSMVSGSRFYFLRHELALLEMALVNFAMSRMVLRGFTPVLPPDMVRSQFVAACGFQPRDEPDTTAQIYKVANTDLSLVGTAEIPLASMYANAELQGLAERPIKHVAFGHAFRTEAGGQGLAIRGLYRVHQFSKVEMFGIAATPEAAKAVFAEMIEAQESMFKELGLCFQVVEIPSEDLGAPAHRKVDMESWMPGRGVGGSFGEISSTSDCTDFQSRRLNIRWLDGKGDKQFAHTLNGTACAVPRMLISILEQHQQADGSIAIPAALRPFMMGVEAIPAKQLFPHRLEHIPPPPTPQQIAEEAAAAAALEKAKTNQAAQVKAKAARSAALAQLLGGK